MSRTRIAVVGVGHLGQHHARNLSAMPDVELVAVVDTHAESARAVAERNRTVALADHRELLGKVDAVSIVVPTSAHYEIAGCFLRHGIATFVEKPLAFSVGEARELVDLARRHKALLQVGHIERFNPAWREISARGFSPRGLCAHRLSRFPFRSIDTSVVFDVMIHDLDLALAVTGSDVRRVAATGARVVSPSLDAVEATVEFADGCLAHFSASRVHHRQVRSMRLWNDHAVWEVDFLDRSTVHQSADRNADLDFQPVMSAEEKERALARLFACRSARHDAPVEPLGLELAEFVAGVRGDRDVQVTGEAGYAAVRLAHAVEQAVETPSQTLPLSKIA